MLHHNTQAEVTGLDRFPIENWPPVAVVHIAFQLMVGCGILMAAVACWCGWRMWRADRIEHNRRLLYALIATAPCS